MIEGQDAVFACGPFIPGAQPVLLIRRPGDNNFGNIDPLIDDRLGVDMDYPFGFFEPSNRTYRYQSALLEENGTEFLCTIAGTPSNITILVVMCELKFFVLVMSVYWVCIDPCFHICLQYSYQGDELTKL